MAYTMTADISRMITAGQKEIFTENFKSFPLEYPEVTSAKTATKQTETYDSMGNLKAAAEKVEGSAITYGKVGQAYQTSIACKTWANGYAHSFEAATYDLYGVINSVKARELARTMRELQEESAIDRYDNAFATNLADGVPLCSNSKPLLNSPGVFNDTLTTGALNPDNIKTARQMFHRFKNHAGGPMKSRVTDGLTHAVNMTTVEEIFASDRKAYEMSNTKNALPNVTWHYSNYLDSEAAWFLYDRNFDHVIFQRHTKGNVAFETQVDFDTKEWQATAIEIYQTGAVPNIGFVGSTG